MKRLIAGIKNSARIRVIVNGVGMSITVAQINDIVFTNHRVAVWRTLETCVNQGLCGLSQRVSVYDEKMNSTSVDVQVDI